MSEERAASRVVSAEVSWRRGLVEAEVGEVEGYLRAELGLLGLDGGEEGVEGVEIGQGLEFVVKVVLDTGVAGVEVRGGGHGVGR